MAKENKGALSFAKNFKIKSMSIIINYEPERNLFFGATTRITDVPEATALSGLIMIFQNLFETTNRLSSKLENLTNGSIKDQKDIPIYITSAIADVWSIIDSIKRIGLVYKFLPLQAPQQLIDLVDQVKLVRDSFHHIDERINEHYSLFGGSVYGDVKWRYRPDKNSQEVLNLMLASAHHITPEIQNRHMGQVELEEFKNKIGVYDVQLIHVGKKTRKEKINEVVIKMDNAIGIIDDIILKLEYHYSETIIKAGDTNVPSRSLPRVIGIRLKTEAFNKKRGI
jgi:hypothetical protein